MKIIIATSQEHFIDMIKVRNQVFGLEQNIPLDILYDDNDYTAVNLVGYIDDVPVATLRFNYLENYAKIGRVAVLEEYRRQDIGKKIMEHAHIMLKNAGVQAVIVSSQLPIVPFYTKLGYESIYPVYEEANTLHLEMKKNLLIN